MADFELSQYEIIFSEYDEYLQKRVTNPISDPLTISPECCDEASDAGWGRGSRPVIRISWDDSQGYLEWLNTQLGIALDDPKRYRLPTEAEWEYAARAGTTTAYSTGDCIDTNQANYDGNAAWNYTKLNGETVNCPTTNLSREKTEPVGSFTADPFHLYDMQGNVWE